MEVRLVVAHPSIETKQIRLGPETLIGRGHECKLRISSGQVSRQHCVIKVTDNGVSVRDLGSSNGTRLNDATIAPETDVKVVAGSTLSVGPLKFVVQFAAPRTTAEEDTEWLPPLPVAAKSHEDPTVPIAGGQDTKGDPQSASTAPHEVAHEVIVGREELQITAGPMTDAEAPADAGQATVHDMAVDPGETIFDISLEDRIASISGAGGPGGRTDAQRASETDLLFEEDDLQRLMADVEAAKAGAKSEGADAPAAGKAPGRGLLGFLKRKKKPENPPPAKSPPTDDNDPLNKFLNDA